MKQQRYRFKLIAFLLFLAFLSLGLYGAWSVRHYGSRWFAHAGNARMNVRKQAVVEGDILDRCGTVLASTVDGQRVFQSRAEDRSAVVHLIGDRSGQIANSVETFHAGYLYGVQPSFLEALHRLTGKAERRGNDVTLTIDAQLCTEAAASFSRRPQTENRSGAAVVMNYLTGEVLALVSLPSFDPDTVDAKTAAALDHPYWNRALQALYPPGSTFKIVTAAALLNRSPDAVSQTFHCTGSFPVSSAFSVRDYNGAVHGDITLRQAFLHSCNGYFASSALNLGESSLRKAASDFGFMQNFLFRDLVVSNSRFPSRGMTDESLAASGYGQSSVTATPLHICLISAAVANNGIMPEPRLLLRVRSSSGTAILRWSSSDVRKVCSSEVAKTLQQLMRDVVQSGGSGSGASVTTMDIRGKTGTADSTRDGQPVTYGWFTGFNALKDLPVALCVLVEDTPEGETGGTTAALIAHDLFTWVKNHPERLAASAR